jgi:hypothetical protein
LKVNLPQSKTMDSQSAKQSTKRLLDPIERTSEVLFGLIMALSFTCAISAAEAGAEDVRTMLVGAIGCNIAWGLIDAVIYLVSNLTERARGLATLRALRQTTDPREARSIISDALPPLVTGTMSDGDFENLRKKLGQISDVPTVPRLGRDDYMGAVGIFFLCFLATFPVVIPFIIMHNAIEALRVSNAIALVMLFLAGYSLGHYAQHRPLRMALSMTLLGSVLVMITIALGG